MAKVFDDRAETTARFVVKCAPRHITRYFRAGLRQKYRKDARLAQFFGNS